ncbi:MAG: peptidyl-prolyl cis-trans isomerase [Rhodocyclaceae bacterium]|nr:peptidyl-prolyl cis-trans isomerase [Rhodocyclaceae bacterium]
MQFAVNAGTQVLATVGSLQVTSADLNAAMASSPFSERFPAMNEDDQASLRGDMLRRLVTARLLTLEAQSLGLDKTVAYRQDVATFRLGLLYRSYMEKLRESVLVPDTTLAAMKQQFQKDPDGLAAAKAAWVSERYRPLKETTVKNLLKQANVRLHQERIVPGMRPDTVLAEGANIRVRYGDIMDGRESSTPLSPESVKEQLNQRVEFLVVAEAAAKQGADASAELRKYESERLPAVMMETKTKEWIPGEKVLKDWFDKHPGIAAIPERRHVGQVVLGSRKEAEAIKARINKGESLFVLAGKVSIDPVSRKQNGDVGWVVNGRGMPELDQALSRLKDGETSDVIATKDGSFHILTILERRPGRQETYDKVRDRVAQAIVNEKLQAYLPELERRHNVSWKVLQASGENGAGPAGR